MAHPFGPTESEEKRRVSKTGVRESSLSFGVLAKCFTALAIAGVIGLTVVMTARALAGKTTVARIDQTFAIDVEFKGNTSVDTDLKISVPFLERVFAVLDQSIPVWIFLALCTAAGLSCCIYLRRRRS